MKAIQVHTPGGPEQMQLADVPVPQPGPKDALKSAVRRSIERVLTEASNIECISGKSPEKGKRCA